ncbi:6-phosphogluconolactonase [Veronia nyctiphanis]|uniref:6-phosphogluconolactonase n=1 Tax=Veronia nyctiphanis TaxID=1278244 RepID=A0A4Q0YI49_9GAMM|nr:6-phosphogluconolactonase [Veronia nyctiphanis]RXJ70380.1 6-phosphogluconolactonase [Veronia nyctiphanis]
MTTIRVFDDNQAVVTELAKELQRYSQLDRPVHISLSGGSTPKQLFALLAKEWATDINWQNLHFWWGDERCVPPTDAESNYGQANALLFSHIDIPEGNIHRIRGEDEPVVEAARISKEIAALIPSESGVPAFDWILLGMGDDGHTASLFPGHTRYDDPALTTVARHPQSGQLRVSKTARLLNNAKRISYLVLGAGKAEMVDEIHNYQGDTELPYPAAHIAAENGETEWFFDAAAARALA